MYFDVHALTVTANSGKRVEYVEVRPIVENSTGEVRVTDIMLQGGTVATVWTGHPSEIRWSFDG
ncbi:hypothetical protein [Bacillus horti]|uniref:Uncharacterized protein n=1 Tax=Caldalkalibacillus horti TaxID=77523 RepID=A0ABT9W5B1_9BACI|nr:hypothetical protein [Bacillus horti]MDQ0168442.1 hypothetical protein [Bacillus horti]